MKLLKTIYLGRDATFIRLMSFSSKEKAEEFINGHGYVEEFALDGDYYYFKRAQKYGKVEGANPPFGPQLVEERYQAQLGNRIHVKCAEWFLNPSKELR